MNTVFNVQIGDKIRGNMEYLDIYIYTQWKNVTCR